ncbi:MAG TPA: Rpn family recombination-promoting nuclease/putative transposase [Kofleriaceae bacterium]
MTSRPHDALFKSAFEAPADAAALLRELLPVVLRELIAWDTLHGEPASFVDPALADLHSDLLYSAQLRTDPPELLHVLLEHLCGAPHKCSYAEPPIMWSGPLPRVGADAFRSA